MAASPTKAQYEVTDDGCFVIRNYHRAHPFSSFLPGIAGLWGTPLWCYYVNRGQAVACFGTQDKDHSILEFQSVKLHQHRTATEGFRTFLRISRGDEKRFYEPFRYEQPHAAVQQTMTVQPHGLVLHEVNETLGIAVNVAFFTVPGEPFAALGRRVTVSNLADTPARIEVLDGIPRMVPYGERHEHLKLLPFVTEGYMVVERFEQRTPFLRMRALPSDSSETDVLEAGNFFLAARPADGRRRLLDVVVDPELIFGDYADLIRPYAFLDADPFDPTAFQGRNCQTCCGFVHAGYELPAKASDTVQSLYGMARGVAALDEISAKLVDPDWFDRATEMARREVEHIQHGCFVHTASREINQYLPATYLDNVLRGGLPLTLKAGERKHVFHVFSRRHGDLERDYNFFELAPTYFSQGNGAFRDVNQNRRNDVWFNPDVERGNVQWFFNLIQPDGFNPLVCKGNRFRITDHGKLTAVLGRALATDDITPVESLLAKAWTPGDLFAFIDDHRIELQSERQRLLESLLAISQKLEEAAFGEGYWTDHWLYNFDLLGSYLAIYPDRLRDVLIDSREYTYWDPDVRVKPRDDKYVLYGENRVWHIDSTSHDPEKSRIIAARTDRPRLVRTRHGTGEIYRANLLQKIICLLTNKVAAPAPSGLGIDMEGGRPGWHDSINGIPGAFGSTTSETFHLRRAMRMVREALQSLDLGDDFTQPLPTELHAFFTAVLEALHAYHSVDIDGRDFTFWGDVNDAKETYREAVRLGFSGEEQSITLDQIMTFLDAAEAKFEAALPRMVDAGTGLYATYCTHEAIDFEIIKERHPQTGEMQVKRHPRGFPCVRIKQFKEHMLPLFLEAPTHAMKIETDPQQARRMYDAMRSSPLFDEPLGMYLVGDSVEEEGPFVGRIWAWAPGWFEAENVFLHIEHKWMLATLAAGLYDAFYEDLRNCLIPFQPIERYGRSPLENASFIVSSRHPRPHYHGRGYLPRSSGTTAEVMEMTLWMFFGRRPFTLRGGELVLTLKPVLAHWLFTTEATKRQLLRPDGQTLTVALPADTCSALFLGHTLVVYHNPHRLDTWGDEGANVQGYTVTYDDGGIMQETEASLPHDVALSVRERRVQRIDVFLAPKSDAGIGL